MSTSIKVAQLVQWGGTSAALDMDSDPQCRLHAGICVYSAIQNQDICIHHFTRIMAQFY